jgi:hypothetical protein
MDSYTDGFPGVVSPILTADLLARIHQLNLDYLELLIAEHTCPELGGMRYLPDRVLEALRATSSDARQMLATTAFSLYSLGFEDQEFWRSALRLDPQPIDGRYGVLSTHCGRLSRSADAAMARQSMLLAGDDQVRRGR